MHIDYILVIITNIAVILYAILIAVGGWLGYRERESKGILIGSCVCALYFVLAFILAWIGPTRTAGLVMDIAGATLLGLLFVYRYYESRKLEVSTTVPVAMIMFSAIVIGLATTTVILHAI